MILAGPPYVSSLFTKTVRRNAWPIVDTDQARSIGFGTGDRLITVNEAVRLLERSPPQRLLTNTEHMYAWVTSNLAGTPIADTVELLKDKNRFRELLHPLYPRFWFHEVSLAELEHLSADQLQYPLVAKPDVGFLSLGVHEVMTSAEWDHTKAAILAEIDTLRSTYPRHVVDTGRFILEQHLGGDEYAVDAYFDGNGAPVVLDVFQHLFTTKKSAPERLYMTSNEIIENNRESFEEVLAHIASLAGIRNFPVHAEFRIADDGLITPIEVNPLRFGGWCTTANLTHHAWGINEYELYFADEAPDWDRVLAGKAGKRYSFVTLDNSTGFAGADIAAFDYDRLLSRLEHPLHFTRVDYRQHPFFGFVFIETSEDNIAEIDWILKTDFAEFITT